MEMVIMITVCEVSSDPHWALGSRRVLSHRGDILKVEQVVCENKFPTYHRRM